MLCCVVLLAFVGMVLRRRAADEPFPPPARSEAATQTRLARVNTEAEPPSHGAVNREAPMWPLFLRGAALGVLVYVVAVTILQALGVIESAATSNAEWLARDAAFAVLALAGLLIAARGESDPTATTNSHPAAARTAAALLIGGGVAWTLAALVDMHLFGMFEFAHGETLHGPVFHSVGFWAVVAGSLLFNRIEDRSATARPNAS